jgi:hypothetical protein
MGGHSTGSTYKTGVFNPPHVRGRWLATALGATAFFWSFYRIYHDGGHHFMGHHPWEDEKVLQYLEKVDEKYGTRYSKDNLHHHGTH